MELVIEIIHTRNFLSYEDCFALHMATTPLHACTSISFNINSVSAIDPMQIVLFFFFLNMSRVITKQRLFYWQFRVVTVPEKQLRLRRNMCPGCNRYILVYADMHDW